MEFCRKLTRSSSFTIFVQRLPKRIPSRRQTWHSCQQRTSSPSFSADKAIPRRFNACCRAVSLFVLHLDFVSWRPRGGGDLKGFIRTRNRIRTSKKDFARLSIGCWVSCTRPPPRHVGGIFHGISNVIRYLSREREQSDNLGDRVHPYIRQKEKIIHALWWLNKIQNK